MLTVLMKSGSLALLHAAIAFAIADALTGSAAIAVGIALLEPCLMSFVFLLHERAWKAIGERLMEVPAADVEERRVVPRIARGDARIGA